ESMPLLRAPQRVRAFSERKLAAVAALVLVSALTAIGRLERSQPPAPRAFRSLAAPVAFVRRPAVAADSLPSLDWTSSERAPSAVAVQLSASAAAPLSSRPATIATSRPRREARPVLADAWWNLGRNVLGGH